MFESHGHCACARFHYLRACFHVMVTAHVHVSMTSELAFMSWSLRMDTFPWPPSLLSCHGHCACARFHDLRACFRVMVTAHGHLPRLWARLHDMVTAHVHMSIPLSCFHITATAHGHLVRLWTRLHETDNCTCAYVHNFAMLSSYGHCVSAQVVTSEHWYKIQLLHMFTEHSYWE